jgi:hypothetical protein
MLRGVFIVVIGLPSSAAKGSSVVQGVPSGCGCPFKKLEEALSETERAVRSGQGHRLSRKALSEPGSADPGSRLRAERDHVLVPQFPFPRPSVFAFISKSACPWSRQLLAVMFATFYLAS